MKKKTIILTIIIIIVTIVTCLIIKLIMDDKKNKALKEKYYITSKADNLLSGLHLSEGTYKILYNKSQYLSSDVIIKDLFEKDSKDIKISNKDLRYYGYIIDKDENQYISTPINSDFDVLACNIPFEKDDYEFIRQNLLHKDNINFIKIFPFKDGESLFVELYYNIEFKRKTFAFVSLSNKTIQYLDDSKFYISNMNLKENVVILSSDTWPSYNYVFNENGDFITKYQ